MTVLQEIGRDVSGRGPAKLREGQPDPVPGRVPVMFTVRESDEGNRSAFANMVDQTYVPWRRDPWIAALMAVELAPMEAAEAFAVSVDLEGEVRRSDVAVERLERSGATVVRFRTGPYAHVWSMSSAAKENADGDNDFTRVFVDCVREWKPQVMVIAAVSRLVRSVAEGGLVTNAVVKLVDQVWVGGYQFLELVGANSEFGVATFSQQAAAAASERTAIVNRTVAGRVGRARGGRWPYGRVTVPFGYDLDPRTRALYPSSDPKVRGRVRAMLLVLGAGATPALTIERLAPLRIPNRHLGREGLLLEQEQAKRNPRALIDGLLSWAPLWVLGEHLYRFACPVRGVQEWNGVPVVSDPNDPRDRGEMQLLLVPGVPEGGWAEPAVLDRFAQIAVESSGALGADVGRPLHSSIVEQSGDPELLRQVGRAGRKGSRMRSGPRARGTELVAPFSGFSWEDGGGLHELKVANSWYRIERRGWVPAGEGVGRVAL